MGGGIEKEAKRTAIGRSCVQDWLSDDLMSNEVRSG